MQLTVTNQLARLLDNIPTLENMNQQEWETPIAEGKFSKAAIVSHLMYWDRFLIQFAIPEIHLGHSFAFPEFNHFNQLASIYATLVSKEHLLNEFKEVRQQLISLVENLPKEILEKEIKVNDHTHDPKTKQAYTFEFILEEFVEHDDHHAKQLVG